VLLGNGPLIHRLSPSFAIHLLEGGAIRTVKELLGQPCAVMTVLHTPCAAKVHAWSALWTDPRWCYVRRGVRKMDGASAHAVDNELGIRKIHDRAALEDAAAAPDQEVL
jgi:hypothetical protein